MKGLTKIGKGKLGSNLGRIGRLARKELAEILSDRRTILTLVLMPLLLYPMLSFTFRQFLVAFLPTTEPQRGYVIGVKSRGIRDFVRKQMVNGAEFEGWRAAGLVGLAPASAAPGPLAGLIGGVSLGEAWAGFPTLDGSSIASSPGKTLRAGYSGHEPTLTMPRKGIGNFENLPHPKVTIVVKENINLALVTGEIDAALEMYVSDVGTERTRRPSWEDWHIYYLEHVQRSRDAAAYLDQHCALANSRRVQAHLDRNGIFQLATPVRTVPKSIVADTVGPGFSLSAMVPLILILMTITGAVYPAIDLTAGERERGTLELLMAAPVPRLDLLVAKYIAVVGVAVLTAAINLAMMLVTIDLTGMTPQVFTNSGVTVELVVQLLFLLALFAAFFSAVLLTLTSFARSFKEAQAYLIPLMLVALGPGVIGMMPGLGLTGIYMITPLLNIVLLARDLLEGNASMFAAAVVVGSTIIYAIAAIFAAAKLFGAEAVLFSEQGNWSDLLRRPLHSQPTAGITTALLGLVLVFPTVFVVSSLLTKVAPRSSLPVQTLAAAVIFGGVPLGLCWWARLRLTDALLLRFPRSSAWPAAVLLAVAALPFVLLVFSWMVELKLTFLTESHEQQLRSLARPLRTPFSSWQLAAMMALTGIAEELFFRGFLLSALLARLQAWKAIVASAALFGLFHFMTLFDKLVPSTLMGLLLGWVCWKTRSVWPAMLLHACYNAILVFFSPDEAGLSHAEAEQLLWWLRLASVPIAAVGIALMWMARADDAKQPIPDEAATPLANGDSEDPNHAAPEHQQLS